MATLAQFAEVLRLTNLTDEEEIKRTVQARLIGVGLHKVCGRCSGCGEYAFNMMTGTTCFGCGGRGVVAQKLTNKLLAEAQEKVASGALEPYFTHLRNKKIVTTATDKVMAAWSATGISKMYNWSRAADHTKGLGEYPEDRRLSDINHIMCNEYNRISDIVRTINVKKATAEQVAEVAAEVTKAVQTIQEAAKLI